MLLGDATPVWKQGMDKNKRIIKFEFSCKCLNTDYKTYKSQVTSVIIHGLSDANKTHFYTIKTIHTKNIKGAYAMEVLTVAFLLLTSWLFTL